MKATYLFLWITSGLYWLVMAMNVVFRFLAACGTSTCQLAGKVMGYLFIPALVLPPLLGLVFLVRLVLKWIDRRALLKYELALALGTAALFLFSMANFPTS